LQCFLHVLFIFAGSIAPDSYLLPLISEICRPSSADAVDKVEAVNAKTAATQYDFHRMLLPRKTLKSVYSPGGSIAIVRLVKALAAVADEWSTEERRLDSQECEPNTPANAKKSRCERIGRQVLACWQATGQASVALNMVGHLCRQSSWITSSRTGVRRVQLMA
jgi:hypothetical protein